MATLLKANYCADITVNRMEVLEGHTGVDAVCSTGIVINDSRTVARQPALSEADLVALIRSAVAESRNEEGAAEAEALAAGIANRALPAEPAMWVSACRFLAGKAIDMAATHAIKALALQAGITLD